MSAASRPGIEPLSGRGRPRFAGGYGLRCPACGWSSRDDGVVLACPREHEPSLLRTEYAIRGFAPVADVKGLFRYRNWLPSVRSFDEVAGSVTYRSEALSRVLGLPNLWVVFNGHWPEIGAGLETATFKDLEAWTVLARPPRRDGGVMVVASAGNTAAAFAWACSVERIPIVIVVPESGLPRLRFREPLDPCVTIVSLVGSADYADAIALANRVSGLDGFFAEGGIRNVGRVDGLGTTMLSAVETIGRIPDYYFQAIGSGAGAIGAGQAARRLIGDGRFGRRLPRFMLSQNLPFAPIHMSWKSGSRQLCEIPADEGRRQIRRLASPVLSNRAPAYSVVGGVYDLLTESGGGMLVADNREALDAAWLFEQVEGIDIDAAAGVALATVMKAAQERLIDRDAVVLLNVTGGGWYRRRRDEQMIPAVPRLELDAQEASSARAPDRIAALAQSPRPRLRLRTVAPASAP